MYRLLLSICAILQFLANVHAQPGVASPEIVSDQTRIALSAVLPEESDALPESARPILLNRLRQLANMGGFAGNAILPQFILAANPVVVDKKIAAAAPPKIWVELELSLYIADYHSKTVFVSTAVSLRGIGATDAEAFSDAFKNFQPGKKELKEFTRKGREQIVAYYNGQCDLILGRIQMLTNTEQADAALDMLLRIPDVSKSCFDAAIAKSEAVYLAAAEQQCNKLVQSARAAWVNAPNRAGADKAAFYLGGIPTRATCHGEADALLGEIKSKMKETESWEREQYKDSISLQKQLIAALRDIGVAYGSGQPDTQINVRGWLW